VPRDRIRVIARRDFDDALLARLHAFAYPILPEDLAHFRVHAETNEVVHVFERDGQIVGFQFWRTAPMELPAARMIMGGKLRVLPEHRGRGLHLRSGLRFFLACKLRHPRTRYYRMSIVSLFGFVSLTSALAEYCILDPHPAPGDTEGRAVRAAFARLAAENDYRLDPDTGLIFVDIGISPETLARFPEGYLDRPEARAYTRINPGWRDNRSDVAFWFRFTPRNLASLVRKIWRVRARPTSPGHS
jgi:GNAT superfamily N-acetyltransferase